MEMNEDMSVEEANKLIEKDNDVIESCLKQTDNALTTIQDNLTKIVAYLNTKHVEMQNNKAKNFTLKILSNLLKTQKTLNNTKSLILDETAKPNTKIYMPLYAVEPEVKEDE